MIYLCTKKSGLRKSFKIFFSQNIFFELFSDDQPVPYTEHVLGGPNPPTRASDSANHASAHGTKCFEKFSKSPKKIGAEKIRLSHSTPNRLKRILKKKMIWSFFVAGAGDGHPRVLYRKIPQKELISVLLELFF